MLPKQEVVAMLLAGGQGSRLGVLTRNLAKPAVPFGGKYRIIDFPLSNCVNSGIETVGVLTQYQPLELNDYIGNGQPWDLDSNNAGVHVLPPYQKQKKTDWYKGTANAIYQNIPFIERYNPDYVVVLSGAGLEDFLSYALTAAKTTIDASQGISLLENHEHEEDGHHDGHTHEVDPHIWLDPENAKIMAENIARGLSGRYPDFADRFDENLNELLAQLDALEAYGTRTLSELSTRSMITFHDGFSYFARAFNLNILAAVEEESGSEASAQELKALITLTEENHLPAVFTEKNGADAAAKVISAATGAGIFTLDMAISGDDYFEVMYRNIDTVKEALA